MSTFKCKMCGGALEIENGASIATCEYCGTQQTLPKLDDDRRANLYDRANHFRRNNEFDKAMGIYEQILNEDHTDAEAYWSLVLCRYGIEYVEDPVTRKRVPTVNRAQFTSVFDDDNYKSALQYADGLQRSLYEEEAKTINEIQKGILAISQKEEPFDVFICYKETDNNGRRTPDSVLANDLYHQLTQEGFKVFFARITLEDKLGTAYEPYIFAALNSSKVMVVLGTKPEYFNAVWVKNEWSRYLALIKQGQKKMLIPAYKDMDPYGLPEEFSHLQAQDMSKLGFMQDLIRGIKKIAQADTPKETVVKETVIAGGNVGTAPLLKRAFMFLEDGDWSSADEYCEKVLDIDPENASAYLGKLMAELHVKRREALKNLAIPFGNYSNCQKAMRFGDETLKKELQGYLDFIKNRNLTALYNDAVAAFESAKTEDEYKNAAEKFNAIRSFRDSEEKAKLCLEEAEIARKQKIYNRAMDCKNEEEFSKAESLFLSISDYLDASALANECKELQIASLMNNSDVPTRDRISKLREALSLLEEIPGVKDADEKASRCRTELADLESKMRAARAKRKKIAIIASSVVCVMVATFVIINNVIIPTVKYNKAVSLKDSGQYVAAMEAFQAMDGYKDSVKQIDACINAIKDEKYDKAMALKESGKYEEAYRSFIELGDFKDAADKVCDIRLLETKEQLKNIKVGSYVTFGVYEQDNSESNGKEKIEWFVLDVKDGKALLVSKYALDCKPYNKKWKNVTWETCTLRSWLNDDFLNTAFSADERGMIPTVTVSADKNPDYSTNPGKATQDKVFLLSISEANRYFSSNSERQCEPTAYAVSNNAYTADNGNCCWWLRSPGYDQDRAAFVCNDGVVDAYGLYVDVGSDAVRPALSCFEMVTPYRRGG